MPRKMRDSGVAWIGAIPEGWECCRLKFIAECLDGRRIPIDKALRVTGPYPYWGAGSIQDYVDNYIFDEEVILLGEDGAPFFDKTRSVAICTSEKIWVNNHIHVLKCKNRHVAKYITYALNITDYANYVSGSILPKLTQGRMNEIPLAVPPTSVQQKIVGMLDARYSEIDAAIASARQSIEEYKALKKSLVFETVTGKRKVGRVEVEKCRKMRDSGIPWIGSVPDGWRVWPMKHLVDILPGYAFDSRDFAQQGTRLLRGINVGVSALRWDETVYWNGPVPEEIKPYSLAIGDLVVGLDRPWIADGTRVTFVTDSDLPCLLVQRVCRIRPKDDFDLRLARYWLASDAFLEALGCETTGVSVPHISTGQIGDFRIALPSSFEQRAIADYLDEKCEAIDALVAEKEALIADLEAYKKSLIFEVVTGKREVGECS